MTIRRIIRTIIEEQFKTTKGQETNRLSPDISTDATVDNEKAIQEAWPNEITYNGKLLFDLFNEAKNSASKDLGIGQSQTKTHEDGKEEKVRTTGEVTYLGYVPSKDKFVIGFDLQDTGVVFGTNNFYEATADFTVDAEGKVTLGNKETEKPTTIGQRDRLHNSLLKTYKDIISIFIKVK